MGSIFRLTWVSVTEDLISSSHGYDEGASFTQTDLKGKNYSFLIQRMLPLPLPYSAHRLTSYNLGGTPGGYEYQGRRAVEAIGDTGHYKFIKVICCLNKTKQKQLSSFPLFFSPHTFFPPSFSSTPHICPDLFLALCSSPLIFSLFTRTLRRVRPVRARMGRVRLGCMWILLNNSHKPLLKGILHPTFRLLRACSGEEDPSVYLAFLFHVMAQAQCL